MKRRPWLQRVRDLLGWSDATPAMKSRRAPRRSAWSRRGLLEPLEKRELLAVLYWDPDGNAANNDLSSGAGLGGSGTWADQTGAYWYNPSTGSDVAWNNANGDAAVFRGTAGNVSVSGSVTASAVTFNTTAYALQNGTLTLSGAITVQAGSVTIGSVIAGALTKAGGGTLTLTGANTYTGTTTINAGTLRVGNAAALSNSMPLAANDGILDLNGYSLTVGSLSGYNGTITDNSTTAGTTRLTVNTSSGSAFYGTIQDGNSRILALEKSGGTQLVLGGINTFTGSTTVSNGTLYLDDSSLGETVLPCTSGIALSGARWPCTSMSTRRSTVRLVARAL